MAQSKKVLKASDYPHEGLGYRLREYRLSHRKMSYRKLCALIGGSVSIPTLWRVEHARALHETSVRELERFLDGVTSNAA